MRPWSWSDPWVVWSVSPDSPPGSWPGRSTRTPPCSAAPFSAPSVCGGWRWLTQSWPSPAAAVWIFEGQVWREIGWWAETKYPKSDRTEDLEGSVAQVKKTLCPLTVCGWVPAGVPEPPDTSTGQSEPHSPGKVFPLDYHCPFPLAPPAGSCTQKTSCCKTPALALGEWDLERRGGGTWWWWRPAPWGFWDPDQRDRLDLLPARSPAAPTHLEEEKCSFKPLFLSWSGFQLFFLLA